MSPAEQASLFASHQQWIDTAGAAGVDAREVLRGKGLSGPDPDIIVLATPEMAELANWIVAFAFGLAASSFFPVLVLGIFSKRVGTVPAVCGMVVGISFTAFYIVATVFFGMERWTFGLFPSGINPQGIGVLGAVLNFATTLVLTPLCRPPSDAVKRLVDSVREPEDAGAAVAIETAPEH